MTNEQLMPPTLRTTFENLYEDLQPISPQLDALNGAVEVLGLDIDTDPGLRSILEDEVMPRLESAITDECDRLTIMYQPAQGTVKLTTVDAQGINGTSPHFLDENVVGYPNPVQGRFDGFQLLQLPHGYYRVYMRVVQGIQVFWAQPTLKNFQ